MLLLRLVVAFLYGFVVAYAAVIVTACLACAQEVPPQPDLDLPVRVESYVTGAPAAPIPACDEDTDARDEPAPVFFGEEIESTNSTLVYVLDVSGSMGFADRLEIAKAEAIRSINALQPPIRFNVVSYNCTLTRLWPGLQLADEGSKQTACGWITTLGAMSGTATGPAVALALSDREVAAVALLTDGDPNCGCELLPMDECHRRMIRNANVQQAVINVFGIGANGAFRAFCQGVAADSLGSYTDVPDHATSRGKGGW